MKEDAMTQRDGPRQRRTRRQAHSNRAGEALLLLIVIAVFMGVAVLIVTAVSY
jgi:hypothetical protein